MVLLRFFLRSLLLLPAIFYWVIWEGGALWAKGIVVDQDRPNPTIYDMEFSPMENRPFYVLPVINGRTTRQRLMRPLANREIKIRILRPQGSMFYISITMNGQKLAGKFLIDKRWAANTFQMQAVLSAIDGHALVRRTGAAPTVEQCEGDVPEAPTLGPVDRIVANARKSSPPILQDVLPEVPTVQEMAQPDCLAQEIQREAIECRPASIAVTAAYAKRQIVQPKIGDRLQLCGNVSKGKCYRAVKEALADCKITAGLLDGEAAKNAGPALSASGFINIAAKLNYNSQRAPVGAVIVYRTGEYGHIEVKAKSAPSLYCSDFCSANHSARPVSGIWVLSTVTVQQEETAKPKTEQLLSSNQL